MAKKIKKEVPTERLMCLNHKTSAIFDVVIANYDRVDENCPICKTDAFTCYYSGDKSPNVRAVRKQEREEKRTRIAARLEGKII